MTNDELDTLYLSLANDYMLCKRVKFKDAVEYVRMDVANELKKRGQSLIAAAVMTLQAKERLIKSNKGGKK